MKITLLKKNNSHDANTYALTKDNHTILIDASADASTVQQHLKESASTLAAIFITHSHFDHILYLDELLEFFNCPVYIHEIGLEKLYSASENLSCMFTPFVIKNRANTFAFSGDETIKIENFLVKTYHTPGHSNCSSCFEIENHLFTGDTLFFNCVGAYHFHTSSKDDMLSSLKKLNSLPAFEKYHPGHARTMDATRAQKVLAENIEELII